MLAAATDEFDVLVTLDTSIEHQQDLGRFGIALLVLRGRTDRLEDLIPLMSRVNRLLPDLEPGQVVEVSA